MSLCAYLFVYSIILLEDGLVLSFDELVFD